MYTGLIISSGLHSCQPQRHAVPIFARRAFSVILLTTEILCQFAKIHTLYQFPRMSLFQVNIHFFYSFCFRQVDRHGIHRSPHQPNKPVLQAKLFEQYERTVSSLVTRSSGCYNRKFSRALKDSGAFWQECGKWRMLPSWHSISIGSFGTGM